MLLAALSLELSHRREAKPRLRLLELVQELELEPVLARLERRL
jgi:hypothetical protein